MNTGWDPELRKQYYEYEFTGGDGSIFERQKELAALKFGQQACLGQAPTAIASCIMLFYNQLPSDSGLPVTIRFGALRQSRTSARIERSISILNNTGEAVKLYSRDFADVPELPLPLDKEGRLMTSVSPTGKTVMVNRFNPKLNVSHLDLYDAATLTSEKSWSQSPRLYYDYSISDKGIVALQKPGIVAADFGQTAWAVVGRAIGNCGGNLPTLYSDDQLVYGCTKLVAASISGQVLMTDVLRGREQASAKKAVAQRGRFVAVSLDTTRSEAAYLLRSDRARDWQPWPRARPGDRPDYSSKEIMGEPK